MIGDILQPTHLLFVLVIALLVLGPKRLPEVGRALGRGLRDFRHALSTDDLREQMISPAEPPSTTATAQPGSTAGEPPAPAQPLAGVEPRPAESETAEVPGDSAASRSGEPTGAASAPDHT